MLCTGCFRKGCLFYLILLLSSRKHLKHKYSAFLSIIFGDDISNYFLPEIVTEIFFFCDTWWSNNFVIGKKDNKCWISTLILLTIIGTCLIESIIFEHCVATRVDVSALSSTCLLHPSFSCTACLLTALRMQWQKSAAPTNNCNTLSDWLTDCATPGQGPMRAGVTVCGHYRRVARAVTAWYRYNCKVNPAECWARSCDDNFTGHSRVTSPTLGIKQPRTHNSQINLPL